MALTLHPRTDSHEEQGLQLPDFLNRLTPDRGGVVYVQMEPFNGDAPPVFGAYPQRLTQGGDGIFDYPFFGDGALLEHVERRRLALPSDVREKLLHGVFCVDTVGSSLAFIPGMPFQLGRDAHGALTDSCQRWLAAATAIDFVDALMDPRSVKIPYSLWLGKVTPRKIRGSEVRFAKEITREHLLSIAQLR